MASTQERERLKAAMGKLASLAPDVLLVERSVARDAQDALLQQNVSLALNVKRSMLDRLARCTGAQVRAQGVRMSVLHGGAARARPACLTLKVILSCLAYQA